MTALDPRSDDPTDSLLDATFPVAFLVAAASWLPAAVFLFGYAVRVRRAELVGDGGLPPLDDVRDLGWTGLRASAVVATFSLPVAFCLGIVAVIPSVVGSRRYYSDALGFVFADPLSYARIAEGFRSAAFRRWFLLATILGGVGSGVVSLVALVPVVGPFTAAFVGLFVLVGVLRLVAAGYEGRVVDHRLSHAEDVLDGDSGPQDAAA